MFLVDVWNCENFFSLLDGQKCDFVEAEKVLK
jgi:hypothetical protein